MGSNYSKKDSYGIWKGLINTSWVGSEHDEWFDITAVSYYIDDIVYTVVERTAPYPELWIRLGKSRNSSIKVMLDQENDLELHDGWFTSN